MSARTPILIVSGVCAWAAPANNPIAAKKAAMATRVIVPPPFLSSYPEIFVQLLEVRFQIGVVDFFHHATVLDNVMPVGERRCKAKILLNQQDRKTFRLQ